METSRSISDAEYWEKDTQTTPHRIELTAQFGRSFVDANDKEKVN